jgi:hypothetical protein
MSTMPVFSSRNLAYLTAQITLIALGSLLAPAFCEETVVAQEGASKTTKGGSPDVDDKRMQLLNEVVAPPTQKKSPTAAKVKEEIMDDLNNKSEPEPLCYYPI